MKINWDRTEVTPSEREDYRAKFPFILSRETKPHEVHPVYPISEPVGYVDRWGRIIRNPF